MVLSNLGVHREQMGSAAGVFRSQRSFVHRREPREGLVRASRAADRSRTARRGGGRGLRIPGFCRAIPPAPAIRRTHAWDQARSESLTTIADLRRVGIFGPAFVPALDLARASRHRACARRPGPREAARNPRGCGCHRAPRQPGRAHVLKETSSDPRTEFWKSNVALTQAAARAAESVGVKRFIFLRLGRRLGRDGSPPEGFSDDSIPHPHDEYTASETRRGNLAEC